MAPEIMQLQKYDAKADLWSVGAILFQLVTGKTPFTGSTQIQLLQNIIKSNELHFPPEIERLTFEEFFNHSFLSRKVLDGSSRSRKSSNSVDCYPLSEPDPVKTEESSHDECLPFFLEDECSGSGGSPSFSKRSPVEPSKGSVHNRVDKQEIAINTYNELDRPSTSRYSSTSAVNKASFRVGIHRPDAIRDDPLSSEDQPAVEPLSRVADSLELIDQDYVIVSGPPMDVSSQSTSASKPSHEKYQSPPQTSAKIMPPSSAPVPIIGATNINTQRVGSLDSYGYAPGTSLESMDIGDVLEKPSMHCMTRIKSLQQCASSIEELVNEKIKAGRHLEAFSIQLVILAIWKQALDICHTQAASAMEGSPSHGSTRLKRSSEKKRESPDSGGSLNVVNNLRPEDISPQIEGEFLREVEHAEQLAKIIEPGSTEMPDAMEMIFQSALDLGRRGG
ncbi:hypothetical protein CRG98_032342, partial [Punica granatum]